MRNQLIIVQTSQNNSRMSFLLLYNYIGIAMECPVKTPDVKRSPWSLRLHTLVKPILFLVLPGGLALGLLIALAYHPVMVWAHGGAWCARFDATGKPGAGYVWESLRSDPVRRCLGKKGQLQRSGWLASKSNLATEGGSHL